MAKKEEEKKPKVEWKKPESPAEVEEALLKNLAGCCTKGARAKNTGFYPTGHFNLDFAIHYGTLPINVDLANYKDFNPKEVGGFPRGRIIETFGEPSGGKSSLCLRAVGAAQKRKKICLWMDREQSFVDSLAELNGVDLDNLFMVDKPEVSAEECFDIMYQALNDGVDLIIVDSVSGLIPKEILDGTDSTKNTVALLARVMGKCIPKLATICAKTGGTVVFINQVRQKPGVMFGNPETTPGGDTLKFYASLRLQITKAWGKDAETYIEDENGQQVLIAQDSYVYIRKNRMSKSPKNGVPIPIYFELFFPNPEEVLFDLGRQLQVIKILKEKFYWIYGDKKERIEAQGRKAFIEAMIASGKTEELLNAIKAAAIENGVVLPPELMLFKTSTKKVVKKTVEQTEASKLINEYLDQTASDSQDTAEATALLSKAEADCILGDDANVSVPKVDMSPNVTKAKGRKDKK